MDTYNAAFWSNPSYSSSDEEEVCYTDSKIQTLSLTLKQIYVLGLRPDHSGTLNTSWKVILCVSGIKNVCICPAEK